MPSPIDTDGTHADTTAKHINTLPIELLEQIFIDVCRRDLRQLARARGVCRRWNHLIQGSHVLQKELFLIADRHILMCYTMTLGAAADFRFRICSDNNTRRSHIRRHPFLVRYAPVNGKEFDASYPIMIHVDYEEWKRSFRRGRFNAPRSMLITQPPIVNSLLDLTCGRSFDMSMVVNLDGITLGDLNDAIQQVVKIAIANGYFYAPSRRSNKFGIPEPQFARFFRIAHTYAFLLAFLGVTTLDVSEKLRLTQSHLFCMMWVLLAVLRFMVVLYMPYGYQEMTGAIFEIWIGCELYGVYRF
ncbi:hypothetical protein NA57DRAFT_57294 [Rhizodiscina lignyota]|uniref:F-box domain-containing protein n=1 Tax=Rhizodiscina lignyota TaxID=1504668 RepID=A0A9P4M896_9PEZI|nr:hypothetical protein NA57DRAFT_57294 [Rhizodiscina lignyota]